MPTFIKAGFWETLCKKCTGYKGWLNLDQFVESKLPQPAYKVYTALLTQSGADDPLTLSSGPVTKGVTYRISANSDGDFSNVGAPNNNENTWFVAINNEVPNSYGTGCQLFYNNAAPVVTVLENTIGNVWFEYYVVGYYRIYSDSLFTGLKTWSIITPADLINNLQYQEIFINDVSQINIFTSSESVMSDSVLYNTPIEIRVYP